MSSRERRTPTLVFDSTWLLVLCALVIGIASLFVVMLATSWVMGVFGVITFLLMPVGLYWMIRNSYSRTLLSIATALETSGPSAIPSVLVSSELSNSYEAKRLQEAFAAWECKLVTIANHEDEMHEKIELAESETVGLAATLGSFIYYTSHTLRTPLNAIRWIVEMFKNEELGRITKKQRAVLDKLEHSTVDLVQISARLQDTLLVMRGDKLHMKNQLMDFRNIVDEAIGKCSIEARRKDLRIEWHMPKEQEFLVSVDIERVETAVRVLIENAVHYSLGPNTIAVTLESGPCINKTDSICAILTVADRGIGISDKEKTRIFEPFFRGEKARLMWVDGTGINLMVTRAVIQSLGGEAWFEQNPKGGTTFYLAIPLVYRT